MSLSFGEFELDQERRQLLRAGEPVPLEPKAYELLSLLVERRPKALSRAQIRDVVWPQTFISESTLAVTVNAIRQALGDDARQPRFIRTVHGFGYAFCGEVREDGAREREAALAGEDTRPYPGLLAFTEADAAHFFGREGEVAALWERVRQQKLRAVIGPSGVGKTSFLRAGVIPGQPPGWRVAYATPGSSPAFALARALGPELAADPEAIDELLRAVQDLSAHGESDRAVSAVGRWRRKNDQALLVLDQFEELFVLNTAETQAAFTGLLGRLAEEADVHVLLSLRDDFLFRCSEHESVRPVFQDLTPLTPLSPGALRRALVEPAAREGVRFEEDALVEEMVEAVGGERGALPLLAFAASRLWEERDRERKLLTREAYEELGGVAGALARHAEATLSRLGSERDGMVREIFRNLVTAEGTRAAADRAELLSVFGDKRDEAGAVLDALVDARLLTEYEAADARSVHGATSPPGGGASEEAEEVESAHRRIEIVHESLLTHWPRLVRWQTQDADGAQLRDQLRQAAHLWSERGRPEDLLWTGTSLLDYRAWRARYPGGLCALEEGFAQASVSLADRRRRRRRTAIAGVVAALAVGLMLVGAFWSRSESARQRADVEARRAEARKLLALGQVELDRYPTAALAYATKSLELADTPETRYFALRVLQRGPTAFDAPTSLEDLGQTAFSPNGEWLLTGSGRQPRLRHRDGGEPVVFAGEDAVRYGSIQYGFGPEGDVLVGDRSGDIRIWSVPEGREVRRLKVERGNSRLFVRGQGFLTATTVGEHDIVRWTPLVEGNSRLVGVVDAAALKTVDAAGTQIAYVPGGYVSGRNLYVRSLEDRSAPPRLVATHAAEIVDIAFHPDGRQIAAGDRSGRIRVWPTTRRAERPLRILESEGTLGLAYSPGGRWLAAFGGIDTMLVRLWDLEAPPSIEPLRLPVTGQLVGGWAFDPSERWLALAFSSVNLWPLAERYPRSVEMQEWFVDDVAFTPDGSTLLSVSGIPDCSLRARSLLPDEPGTERILLRTPLNGPRLAVEAGGKSVAVAAHSGSVFVVPFSGGPPRELRGFSEDVAVVAVAFSPDGRRVAAGVWDGPAEERVIRVWDLENGGERVLGPLPGTVTLVVGAVTSLAFLDDDRLLSSGAGGVFLFDLRSDDSTPLSSRPGLAVAIDRRNGSVFAVLGEPEEIVRLDLDGRPPTRVASCVGCSTLAVDPTGTILATGSFDGLVRIGPASGGDPHLFFGQTTSAIPQSVTFSPDGRWVASAGEARSVRLWPVPDVTRTPLHLRSHQEVLTTLHSWTNLRAVEDPQSSTGWKLEPGPFPGWETLPHW